MIQKYKVGFRGWWYLFQRDWYSLYRWRNIDYYDGYKVRIIDCGIFYFSIWRQEAE